MKEIQELRIQLSRIFKQVATAKYIPELENDGGEVYRKDGTTIDAIDAKKNKEEKTNNTVDANQVLPPPSREQKVLLRQIITSGFIDQVARRVPEVDEQGVYPIFWSFGVSFFGVCTYPF